MTNTELSIVVVFNNRDLFENVFKKSLKRQAYKNYELIGIDNTKSIYKSAVDAYTAGAFKSKGKYIVFSHQDIIFNDDHVLDGILNYLHLFQNGYGVLGYSGARKGKDNKVEYVTPSLNCNRIEDCFTVDECFFITTRELFNIYKFSDIGETWHLYAVEYCLHVKKYGYKIAAIPMNVTHISNGDRNSNFFMAMRKLLKLYRDDFTHIYTTCIDIKTKRPLADFTLIIRQYIPVWVKKIRRRYLK